VAGVAPAVVPPEPRRSLDRVPVPEDGLRELNVTRAEEMEFFIYKCRYDDLTEGQEHALKMNWLRERRREELEDPQLAAEHRENNERLTAQHAQSEATRVQPSSIRTREVA
jgi:hypothetical protein